MLRLDFCSDYFLLLFILITESFFFLGDDKTVMSFMSLIFDMSVFPGGF